MDDRQSDHKCKPGVVLDVFTIPLLDRKEVHVARNCCHNEIVGLKNRYLKGTEHTGCTYDVAHVERLLDELCDLLRPKLGEIPTLEEFCSAKKGKLRKRYDDAVRKVLYRGFRLDKDCDITGFVKNEKMNEHKPPRMIMGRNPIYNLIYGRYTTMLEEALKTLPDRKSVV